MSKEVKRIAEAAKARKPEWYALDGHDWFLPSETMEFMSSVTPEYVLALLVEREALKALLISSREFVAVYVNSSFFGPNARKQLEAIDAALQGAQP